MPETNPLLSFGQFWGKYIDAVINNSIAGRAGFGTIITLAQTAGLLVSVRNGQGVELTYSDRSKYFRVESVDRGYGFTDYRAVVPKGMFPEIANYAGVDGADGELLRYANEGE